MRVPLRSEPEAFRVAWGLAAVIVVCVLVGYFVHPVVGAALFAVIALGVVVWDVRSANPDRRQPLREAAEAAPARPLGSRKRILVVSNETLEGEELKQELLDRGQPRPALRVVAPILPSRTHYVTTDIDSDREQALARLEATLAWARAQGFEASGEVGDQSPFTAIEDQLRRFGADEILISTHPPERSNWLESGLVERVRDEIDILVTHVVVDLERHRVEIASSE